MDNSLNTTRNTQNGENPQGSAANPGASNSSDFQSTAGDSVLRQEAREGVSVESTGQPIQGGSQAVAKPDNTAYFWVAGGLLVVLVGAFIILRLLRTEEKQAAPAPAAAHRKPASKKSVAAKSGSHKKSAAKKRRR